MTSSGGSSSSLGSSSSTGAVAGRRSHPHPPTHSTQQMDRTGFCGEEEGGTHVGKALVLGLLKCVWRNLNAVCVPVGAWERLRCLFLSPFSCCGFWSFYVSKSDGGGDTCLGALPLQQLQRQLLLRPPHPMSSPTSTCNRRAVSPEPAAVTVAAAAAAVWRARACVVFRLAFSGSSKQQQRQQFYSRFSGAFCVLVHNTTTTKNKLLSFFFAAREAAAGKGRGRRWPPVFKGGGRPPARRLFFRELEF